MEMQVPIQKMERIRRSQNFGFSLVELMVTLVVMGIVMSVAVPNFIGMIDRNKVIEAGNRLTASIMQVRSEAIKRNSPIALRSNTTHDWHLGWSMYAGAYTGGDAVDAGEVPIRVVAASNDGVTITGDNQAGMWLSFFANGMLNENANATFIICNNGDAATGRILTVDRGGRTRLDVIPDGDDCT